MLILALSDAHIPDRAIDLPLKFKKLLGIPNKISQVVLLGNCTRSCEFLNFVNDISPNVTFVRGEFDNSQLPIVGKNIQRGDIPMDTVIKQGDFKIGCCNGYTVVPKNDPLSLLALARQLDVDILLWGGTHNVEAYTLEGKFFVNPGSCTGAFNTDWPIAGEEDPLLKMRTPPKEEDKNVDEESAEPKETFKEIPTEGGKQEVTAAASSENNTEKSDEQEDDACPDENSNSDDDLDIPELDVDGSNDPSFCLLDIQGSTCALYIYIYVDGEVKVDKVVYKKTINI